MAAAGMTAVPQSAALPPLKNDITLGQKLLVGAAAGIFGTTVTFPVDLLKTHLQEQTGTKSARTIVRGIRRKHGWRGMYQGLGINLVGVTPEKAIKLAVNDTLRERFENSNRRKGIAELHMWQAIFSGSTAGFVQAIATNPMEICKIRLQLAKKQIADLLAVGDAAAAARVPATGMAVVKHLRFSGLYRATHATLLRDVPFSAIFFPSYALLKDTMLNYMGRTKENEGVIIPLVAATITGGVSAALVTPVDTIKTRLQSPGGTRTYGGIINCYHALKAEGGAKALYKGALQRGVVVGLLFGVSMSAFELQKKYLSERAER